MKKSWPNKATSLYRIVSALVLRGHLQIPLGCCPSTTCSFPPSRSWHRVLTETSKPPWLLLAHGCSKLPPRTATHSTWFCLFCFKHPVDVSAQIPQPENRTGGSPAQKKSQERLGAAHPSGWMVGKSGAGKMSTPAGCREHNNSNRNQLPNLTQYRSKTNNNTKLGEVKEVVNLGILTFCLMQSS